MDGRRVIDPDVPLRKLGRETGVLPPYRPDKAWLAAGARSRGRKGEYACLSEDDAWRGSACH
jgi:hypothetical protein